MAVDGRVSHLSPVLSGVPQGTVLGPVLFLIHIRNIVKELSVGTTATSFADDTLYGSPGRPPAHLLLG